MIVASTVAASAVSNEPQSAIYTIHPKNDDSSANIIRNKMKDVSSVLMPRIMMTIEMTSVTMPWMRPTSARSNTIPSSIKTSVQTNDASKSASDGMPNCDWTFDEAPDCDGVSRIQFDPISNANAASSSISARMKNGVRMVRIARSAPQ